MNPAQPSPRFAFHQPRPPASSWLLALPLLLLLLLALPGPALAKAVSEMEQLDRLRVGLASTLEGRTDEPTMGTMKEV